jgi:ABC-type nitrate/sulfonate/bicarbonate transport system permease component
MTAWLLRRLPAWRPNIAGLATIAACVVLWEGAIRLGALRYQYLPAPSAIVRGAGELVRSGELVAATLHTLQSMFLGWAIAVALGVALGVLLGASPILRRYCLASIEVLRPMPAIAFVPVALVLFGFSTETELMVIVLPALWPMLINTMGGMMGVHARLHDVGRTFRLSRAAAMRKILLPAAAPAIVVGARISLTLALVLAVLAEMVGNPEGLGYEVVQQQQAMRPDLMFAYVVEIGLIGIALNTILVRLVAAFWPAGAAALGEARP